MDGASTGPDAEHANNANMYTPPDGSPPLMQMYLWRSPYRNMSSGSDAAILYHEYTHGLSNRLVTDADGVGALNSAQAGAMGEAWSDFYAQDFIVGQYPALDTGASGEVNMGEYTDFGSKLRSEPIDCPVGADVLRCPGRPILGSGGYTYGDFGRISGSAEVHADGEIWAQTLWDVRTVLGPEKARALVTTGMALLPPEPSFLDARNGILLADQTLFAGTDNATLWNVFAARGMGFFAAAIGGEDTAPAESFALPPAADGPKGTITGRLTNALGGAPVVGVKVGLAGLSTYTATTDADGRYTIAAVPEGTYLKVVAGGSGFDSEVTSISVTGGSTINFSPVLRRNWASTPGGAAITESNGREYSQYGCGPNAAVDQSLASGWSTDASAQKFLIVQLPATIDVTQFAFDPAETCGDTSLSATAGYRVETSRNGTVWTIASAGTFTSAQRHTLNFVTPTAGTTGVRFARLTLLTSQGVGAQYRDLAEFGVYGAAAGTTDITAPETTIDSGPPSFAFSSSEPGSTFECKLDAGTFAACTSPYAIGTLADGEHTFSVRATDAAGNVDLTPATRTFTVDTVTPETTLAAGPAPFTFSSNEPNSTFECKLDAADFAACTSPHSLGTLADGEHTFSVRATDAAGNVDLTPATRTFTVDTAPPETSITSTSSPYTFSSSEPNSTFECRIDTSEFASCTSPYAVGTLADGDHTFSVRATDAAGNTDQSPASRTFTVDTLAPQTTIDSGPDPFRFSSSESNSTFECKLDAAEYASCTSPYTHGALADGDHTFSVRAIDAAGNTDLTPASMSFVTDASVPETAIDSGPSGLTRDATPEYAFSANEPGATFECKLDGPGAATGSFVVCVSPRELGPLADGTYTLSVQAKDRVNTDATPATREFTVDTTAPDTTIDSAGSTYAFSSSEANSTFECRVDAAAFAPCTSPHALGTLPDGEHTFSVRATDAAGNVDLTPATRSFTVDTAAPDTVIDSGPSGATNDATPTFTFSSSEASTTFECQVDSEAFASCTSPKALTTLSDGPHTFTVRATDAAGLTDPTPASRSFTVDTATPNTAIDEGPNGATRQTTPQFTFFASEPGSSFECRVDAGAFEPCTTPHTLATLTDGEHTFSVRATDAAGNTDQTPATRTFTVDATPPDTTITAERVDRRPPVRVLGQRGRLDLRVPRRRAGTAFALVARHRATSARSPTARTRSTVRRAIDAGGNIDPTPAARTFTVDTTPPETTHHRRPGVDRRLLADVHVLVQRAGLDVRVQARRRAQFADCTSPRTLGPLADGTYTLTVRATTPPATSTLARDPRVHGRHDRAADDDRRRSAVLHASPPARRARRSSAGSTRRRSRPARRRSRSAVSRAASTPSRSARRTSRATPTRPPRPARSRSPRKARRRRSRTGPAASPTTTSTVFELAASPAAATFECKLDAGPWVLVLVDVPDRPTR